MIILDVHARDIVDRFVRDSEMSARRAEDISNYIVLIDGQPESTGGVYSLRDCVYSVVILAVRVKDSRTLTGQLFQTVSNSILCRAIAKAS